MEYPTGTIKFTLPATKSFALMNMKFDSLSKAIQT